MNSSPVTASTVASGALQQPTASEHDLDFEHEPDHEHDHTRWAENAHRADEALWPDSVANPRRTKVR